MDYTIKSVVKSFEILEALSEKPATAKSLTERLGMNKSTLHRFLYTLEKQDYITQSPTNEYHLSQKFIQLGLGALSHLELTQVSKPYLVELSQEIGECTLLAGFSQHEVFYLDKVQSPHAVRIVLEAGKRAPCYCVASGKVYLAHLSEQQLFNYLNQLKFQPITSRTIQSKEALLEELEQVRLQGYATDDEEYEVGLRGIAAPIFDLTGRVIAAICVAGVSLRLTEERLVELSPTVRRMAAQISSRMGAALSEASTS
ncbi:IclR family transcriptional regulator [Ammoniphilus sp. YIM 78166]|uniref:IclR family transcriptional regulator n=1 Tax=Ammoniphilus sp. YIM 78166 TaxID=1644106 RepID=UPI00106F7BAF|nr:IclR family transcriptional regulator [Ammoniphilus sp. YIM 78166]